MHYGELPPPENLAHIIRCFWFLRGAGAGEVQPVVPDGRAEIVLHLGEPFGMVTGGGLARQADALISGQLTRPVYLGPLGGADVVGIRFRTAAAGPALGISMDTLRDHVVAIDDVMRGWRTRLLRAASGAARPEARAARLAEVLAGRLSDRLDPVVSTASSRLSAGQAIANLAADAGISERTLERRMHAAVGYSPRTLRQVMRFRRAFRALEAGVPPARVALDTGYHDQAHLTREFRRFAGAPPAAFFQAQPDLAAAMMSEPYKT